MQWLQVGTSMLALTMMLGCPSGFGKEGRVAKAAHQDTLGLVRKYCSELERREFCGPGKEKSKECLEACGE